MSDIVKGGMGPRMIGAPAHRLATIASRTSIKGFGKRMLGDSDLGRELEAAEQALATEQRQDNVVQAALEAKLTTAVSSYSLTELGRLLNEAPARLGELFTAEQARPDGMRKGALRLFIATEENREGGGDEAFLAVLHDTLTSLGG